MFARATITLDIGPHSSINFINACLYFACTCVCCSYVPMYDVLFVHLTF